MNHKYWFMIAVVAVVCLCLVTIAAKPTGGEVETTVSDPMPTETPILCLAQDPNEYHNILSQETDKFEPEYLENGSINYFGWSSEDFKYLSECISGEAQGCSWEHMLYTGSVVLNRKDHSGFPNTIKDICLEPRQYACFNNGVCYTEATEKCKAAAYVLLKTGSLLPKKVIFQAEFEQGDGVYIIIDNTYFCY